MGFHISWVAVHGKPDVDVYAGFRLHPTQRREDVPESPLLGASLGDGWVLLFANDSDELPVLEPAPLAKHSKGCELVACLVEECAMISAAVHFKNEKEVWFLAHDSTEGLENLFERGNLPDTYCAIKEHLLHKQRLSKGDVDYVFDIPIELAKSLVGFRHDDFPPKGAPFTVLEIRS